MNAGEVIQSRYRLEQQLGKGGMATVWKAHDLRLERPVALKCLMAPLSQDPTFLVRFFQEAQQAAGISHPNVVEVLDFGDGDDCPYLVMEYLPGGSLNDMATPIDPKQALTLIAEAAAGVGAAHETGLVHRDLKPGNIMLTEDGTAKVADFGIAVSRAQERLTATGTAIGSPHYVSPEQASGRPTGPSSDVYSLGVVLHELLTGRRPFELENAMALAIAHVEEAPEPPSAHNPALSPAIDAVVMRCLDKDPEARFANGAEMSSALGALAAGHDTAPFAAVAAASQPTAATAAAAAPEDFDEPEAGRTARRGVAVALLAATFLGLLVFGVMALGRDGGEDEKKAAAADVEQVDQQGSINAKESPSEAPEALESTTEEDVYEEDTEAVEATPVPEETEEPAEEEVETEVVRGTGGGGGGGTGGSEPTPEPTSEPTAEPTSEPTSAPEPTPTP